MNSLVSYKFLSKIYGLIDTVYFRKEKSSPRNAVLTQISGGNLKILDMCTGTGQSIIDIAERNPNAEIQPLTSPPKCLKSRGRTSERES